MNPEECPCCGKKVLKVVKDGVLKYVEIDNVINYWTAHECPIKHKAKIYGKSPMGKPRFNLTEKQTHDLIVKGECEINGIKITALYEGRLFDNKLMKKLKEEHLILEDYKEKVEQNINTYFPNSHAFSKRRIREQLGL